VCRQPHLCNERHERYDAMSRLLYKAKRYGMFMACLRALAARRSMHISLCDHPLACTHDRGLCTGYENCIATHEEGCVCGFDCCNPEAVCYYTNAGDDSGMCRLPCEGSQIKVCRNNTLDNHSRFALRRTAALEAVESL
jgi:hypothetical protein